VNRERPTSVRRAVVTLADVAAHVGVSPRTVSRVVNDQGGCSDETRLRILAAIDELGYRPNLMARSLLNNRSDTIGLVGRELADPFFTELADGVQRAARRIGRTMFFATTDEGPARQREILTSLQGHGVDGVIVFSIPGSEADLLHMAEFGLPLVLVNTNQPLEGPNIATIQADLHDGAVRAVQHLVERGRKRIAFATDRMTTVHQTAPRRQAGYRKALANAGIRYDERLVAHAANTVEGGRECVRRLMALPKPPDAIFAYNDLMAIGALQELRRLGAEVPDDVALVGFDDIAICTAVVPRLTSVRIDRNLLGERAVALLQDLLEHPDESRGAESFPVELIVRESS
jgi:LacI family transcriptional regulator